MAYQGGNLKLVGESAAADLSSSQFHTVKLTSSGVNLAGDGEQGVGVLQNKPESGQAAEVITHGSTKAVIGAAVTVGASLASNASGRLIPATTGEARLALAQEAGSADGEIVTVLMMPHGDAP